METNRGDAFGIADSQAGNSQEHLEGSAVEVKWEKMAVPKSPRKLGVDIEIEVGLFLGGDLMDSKPIKAEEPICLIEAMFPNQRRSFEGKDFRGIWDGTKSRKVDAPEFEVFVEITGAP